MDKDKWMTFINHLWLTIGYRQLVKAYVENQLGGIFFDLTGMAIRNELLMRIAHTVHLCEQIAEKFDVGNEARKTLTEILDLYKKGDSRDNRSVLKFEDCGVKPFRDKVLAHPLDHIKELLGKPQYQISLKWDTVDHTLHKIKEFCDQVERHNTSSWDMVSYKDEVAAVDFAFQKIMWSLTEAAKHNKLKHDIGIRGKKVYWDCQKDEIVIEE